MEQLLHNFLNCLSVPFYDIISANNVENQNNNDVEFGEEQTIVIGSGFGNEEKKSGKENEPSVLTSGQSFKRNKEQSFPGPNDGENSETKYQNGEGECFVHIFSSRFGKVSYLLSVINDNNVIMYILFNSLYLSVIHKKSF